LYWWCWRFSPTFSCSNGWHNRPGKTFCNTRETANWTELRRAGCSPFDHAHD
jgi:hypothetical protein